MKIHFFKYNFFRQFLFYSMIIIFGLIATDNKHQSTQMLIFSGCIAAVFVLVLIYQYLSYLIIDETGVTYRSLLKKYKLEWDEIGNVDIIKRWNKNKTVPWIIILRSDKQEDMFKKINVFNRKGECITCAFSEKIRKEIIKYWRGDTTADKLKSMMDELEKL